MNGAPAFYKKIRQNATKRWEQLEQDPELAGPWYQLFQQVQSPRHVLSELLQNADDAGATEASVRIDRKTFIFEHNGDDFSEEDFVSLCRFGYSNKRVLHTIGFRGIGFKSTFSLGDYVKLFTPSLSVYFHRKRFTEPHWLSEEVNTFDKTRVVVKISDNHRQREVEKNLEEWFKSPVSLLFFKNIRRMRIGARDLNWSSIDPGLVPNSEWMALNGDLNKDYLLIRSVALAFPIEVLQEIRQERMLHIEEEIEFPPCNIEIVLGAKGRLYVVLPTGIETNLPFACNAPFIQDPARLKIKDPETSPTNRWLLERAGTLAASAMLCWLRKTDMPTIERVRAYGLFPDVDRNDASIEGVCGTTIEEAFSEEIRGQNILLTEGGSLTPANRSIAIPQQLFNIWSADQVATFLDEEGRPALCRHIDRRNWNKFVNWGLVEEFDKERVLETMQARHLPKPKSWRNLLNLWDYVAPEVTDYRNNVDKENIRVLPVQGKDVLYASTEIVRLGESKLLKSQNDWEFLSKYLIVLDPNWPRYLAKQRRKVSENYDPSGEETVRAAYAVLERINMAASSDVSKAIEQVAKKFFSKSSNVEDCVRFAQITAKLRAKVGNAFKYVTNELDLRSTNEGVLFDSDGILSNLLPKQDLKALRSTKKRVPFAIDSDGNLPKQDLALLHSDYTANFLSCSSEDWREWVSSGLAGLHTFVPIDDSFKWLYRRRDLDQELQNRGFEGALEHEYKNPRFFIKDWDFQRAYWEHWQSLEVEHPTIWEEIIKRILSEKETYWSKKASARIGERSSNGRSRIIARHGVTSSWVLKLRQKKCLPNTHLKRFKPGDLLRRTSQTEPLIGVEDFVHSDLDNNSTCKFLDLMGVQSTPAGPDRLLDFLRALSKANIPPVHEVDKWYRRLDQIMNTCSTKDFKSVKGAFQSEKLILTQNGFWESTPAVFLSSDEERISDVAVIRTSVNELMLWRKIGVSDRPTDDLIIDWFKSLPKDNFLEQEDKRRVRSLLTRCPMRIWEECGHWLNLAGEWAPVDNISYSIAMQTLVHWRNLFPEIKKKTADLQRLPTEITKKPPFRDLPSLASQIEMRFHSDQNSTGATVRMEWLTLVGTALRRVQLDTIDDTEQIRKLANRLVRTNRVETPNLEIIPYIEGKPAGIPRNTDVLWLDDVLHYGNDLPKAKLARRIPEEIGREFGRADIKSALAYSFERSAQDVRDYFEENFKLAPANEVPEQSEKKPNQNPTAENGNSKSGSGTAQEKIDSDTSEDQRSREVEEDDNHNIGTVEAEDEQDSDTVDRRKKPRPSPKPAKPSIMECYATLRGFQKNSDKKFSHRDGSWIARKNGELLFPWEHRTASGDIVRYYLPKDHCLERKPLQIEADVLALVQKKPETYAFILSDIKGSPVEVTGSLFCTMLDKCTVTLYPATYRLVYNDNLQR